MSEVFSINKLDQGMLTDSAAFPEVPVFDNPPLPFNYRVALYPRAINNMSKGGIEIPDTTIEAMRYLRQIGCVVGMGPSAFTHPDLNVGKLPEIGDWVLLPRHAGEYVEHIGFMESTGEEEVFLLKVVRDVDFLCGYAGGLRNVRGM